MHETQTSKWEVQMKKTMAIAMCAGLLFVAACGGSSSGGGGGAAADEAEAAFNDLAAQVEACLQPYLGGQVIVYDEYGLQKQLAESCDCAGGGTIALSASQDLTTLTVTLDNCVTASGESYSGQATSTDGGATINGSLQPFGQCASGTATNVAITGACAGSVSANCDSGSVTCSVVDGSGDECDFSC